MQGFFYCNLVCVKTRFIKEIGTRVYLRVFNYSSDVPDGSCSHDARIFIKDVLDHFLSYDKDGRAGGEIEDYDENLFPKKCDKCGSEFSENAKRQVFNERIYNTASGFPEPGDLYYIDWLPEKIYFDNHTGPFLVCTLPNGYPWYVDSRASNCDMPDERMHRCWCKHGSPEDGTINVDKNGHTCGAGAGSIIGGGWHGYLRNGELVVC